MYFVYFELYGCDPLMVLSCRSSQSTRGNGILRYILEIASSILVLVGIRGE